MLLHQGIEHLSIVYTCNTCFVMHVYYSGVSGQCSHTTKTYVSLFVFPFVIDLH